MSSQAISLAVEPREELGKKVAKIRREGRVPAVVYERGKESSHISVDNLQFQKVWNTAGKHHVIELSVDGQKRLTLIKDVSYDPVKGSVSHIAFHAVNQKEKVEAEIPIEITGDIPAEHKSLFLVRSLDSVVVRAFPQDLPDRIEISGESLKEVGDMIKVENLSVGENIEITTEPDRLVVIVEEPRAVVEEVVEEEAEADSAEVPSEHGGDSEKSEE